MKTNINTKHTRLLYTTMYTGTIMHVKYDTA